jgi:hypothetical protein
MAFKLRAAPDNHFAGERGPHIVIGNLTQALLLQLVQHARQLPHECGIGIA